MTDKDKRPPRTDAMRSKGQVWVWIKDHWEIRGTGLKREPRDKR